jgi:protein O-mannosyl-transferase
MLVPAVGTLVRVSGPRSAVWLRWLVLLPVVFLCYLPGLSGGFVFDDEVNILQNESLRINGLNAADLWAAAWSGHAGPLGRPVSLLTFALNYYVGGPGFFHFKLVNLLIHLGNIVLVAALAQRLSQAFVRRTPIARSSPRVERWSGWIVAALWGLHPLNLTSVLYVVQRMTSLSTLFGLAALLVFVWYRDKTSYECQLKHQAWTGLWATSVVVLCLLLSVLSKETGLVFVPLLLWVEFWIYRFKMNGKPAHIGGISLRHVTIALLVLISAYIAVFRLPNMLVPAAFANRDFTLIERGMTEARVLFFYLRMFLLPSNAELSLYHDDFRISHSLWDPPTTVFSLGALASATAAAWVVRKRIPELPFAWGWFLIAHALESTVFPLELVHEHRNYFATIGFLLMVPLALQRAAQPRVRRLLALLLAGYLGLLGFVTHGRALQWSNNVDWAVLEASYHPNSARATYELARVYMILRQQTGDERFGKLADQSLVQATQAYKPGVLPFMARIQLAYFRGMEPDPRLVSQVKEAVRTWPYYNSYTGMLSSMVTCQIESKCHLPDAQVLEMLNAALENPTARSNERGEVLKLMAQYHINKYHDLPKGGELIRQAIAVRDQASSRLMYAQALAMQAQYNDALDQLDKAAMLDSDGIYRHRIERERSAIQTAINN